MKLRVFCVIAWRSIGMQVSARSICSAWMHVSIWFRRRHCQNRGLPAARCSPRARFEECALRPRTEMDPSRFANPSLQHELRPLYDVLLTSA